MLYIITFIIHNTVIFIDRIDRILSVSYICLKYKIDCTCLLMKYKANRNNKSDHFWYGPHQESRRQSRLYGGRLTLQVVYTTSSGSARRSYIFFHYSIEAYQIFLFSLNRIIRIYFKVGNPSLQLTLNSRTHVIFTYTGCLRVFLQCFPRPLFSGFLFLFFLSLHTCPSLLLSQLQSIFFLKHVTFISIYFITIIFYWHHFHKLLIINLI